jgi:hypothetical protein
MTQIRTAVLILVGLALCGLALPAQAAPSLMGYTGLLLTPTADALAQDEYNVAFFALELEEGIDESVWAANLGVAQDLEVGFARIKPEGSASETFLNGKYQLQREDGSKPALAAGVIDLTDERDTTVYFVMSKSVHGLLKSQDRELTNPRIHVGIGGGLLDGIFAGASVVLGGKLTLLAEYDTEDVNLGARLALGRGLRAHAGWIRDLNDFAVGLSFNKTY